MLTTGTKYLIIIGTLINLGFIIGFIVFVVKYTRRYHLLEYNNSLKEKAHEMELAESIIKSQEKERKEIGEELHDDIAPELSAALMNLNAHIAQAQGQDLTFILNAAKYIDNGIQKIRDASHLLHPSALTKSGFFSALQDYCHMMNSSKDCIIEIHSLLEQLPIEQFKQLMILRMIQELVLNGIRHSKATHLKVSIFDDNQLNFIVLHNGTPFLRADYLIGLDKKDALGLKNIQHRLNLLGGTIHFGTNQNRLEQKLQIKIPIHGVE